MHIWRLKFSVLCTSANDQESPTTLTWDLQYILVSRKDRTRNNEGLQRLRLNCNWNFGTFPCLKIVCVCVCVCVCARACVCVCMFKELCIRKWNKMSQALSVGAGGCEGDRGQYPAIAL